RPEGARSARFLCWIPACAGMARWGHGNGGVGFICWIPAGFLHRLASRNLIGDAEFARGIPAFAGMTWRRPMTRREADDKGGADDREGGR
ncbi:MAG: hypothetical protein OXU61_04430, partial [Gammaproteobacteria bacterium]|nr:hypothetical protein [Gammaproteobacteria bacterium]